MITDVKIDGYRVIMPTRLIKRLDVGMTAEGMMRLIITDVYGESFALDGYDIESVVDTLIGDMQRCHANPILN